LGQRKEKRMKNYKSKKRIATLSLHCPAGKKKDKKKKRKRVQAHTEQKVSILIFSFKLKIEEVFCGKLCL